MTKAAIEALGAEIERASAQFAMLTDEQWALPSGCAGWRVQDVVTHMACVFHQIADPATIETGSSAETEQNAEVPVQARKDWDPGEVLAEYDEWAAKGLAALAALQEPPMADTVVPLADLGSHPLHLLGNAIVFDHYCHIRHDIGASIVRAAGLAKDPRSLSASLEWMLAGLPQMCAAALASCDTGVNLRFTDVDQTWAVCPPAEPGGLWTTGLGAVDGLATVDTTAHDFISWGTKRSDWRACGVTADDAVARTLDAFNVI